ncbi:hypothetical protein WAI453_004524 [Rhynchosporium graminicola]|uniref:3-beta hydroxysteroid dehydrogenase/isomerase domain-containing protein n=1 Tax=Rhynchosporium graminicola TaxID=2792576 RepID=A0A1E1LLM4_9HELO|nr:uncharacterized protein RCO7_03876 [Rhynchosporium commune]
MTTLHEDDSSSEISSPVTSHAPSGTLTRMSSFELHRPGIGPQLGDVLVVGGCGFLGHHLVKFLLVEPTCTSISVMCRSPFKNLHPGVTYHIGDITNLEQVRHVMNQVRPKTIFNTASPHAYKDHEHVPDIFKVNINGNQNLLEAAVETGTVQAYIYTSSAPIVAGSGRGYDHADETTPTLAVPVFRKGDPYHLAKSIGDKIVLEANGKHGIRTCTIRPTALYGEGDGQMIGPVIDALEAGQTRVWMGYNDIEMDVVYVGHVAITEILAAKGLLNEMDDPDAPRVAGEAFNITDDQPSPPLTFFRKYWALAGDRTPLSSVWYIAPGLVLFLAHIAEWIVWLTTWGKLRPKCLILERMEFILFTRTYSIKKARERLGFVPWAYQPYPNQEEALKGAVDWFLQPENHGPVKTGNLPSWPETPFKLISTTGIHNILSIPQKHHCMANARFMAQTHNTIFRALNSIYQHSYHVLPGTDSATNLLSYCSITYDFMHHHQLIEESHYFPEIERVTGLKGLMSENLSQHKAMDKGMEAFRRYAETTSKEIFDGGHLRRVIDAFRKPYEQHQHEEIKTILELGNVIESKVLKGIDMRMRAEAERQSDIFKAAAFVYTAQDASFQLDNFPSTGSSAYPPVSPLARPFIPYIISLIFSARHSSSWDFAPSTIHGKPKSLPTSSQIGKFGKTGTFLDGEEIYNKGVSGAWMWWDTLLERIGGEEKARKIVLAVVVLVIARFWYS